MRANFEKNEVLIGREKITLKRGQFLMGGIKAEEMLKIARTTIYYWLDFMEREGMVDIKKTNKYTIITIKNWDDYQSVDIKKTSNDTTDGQQMDTEKNNIITNKDIYIGIRDFWNSYKLPTVNGFKNNRARTKLLPECRKITPDIEKAIEALKKKDYTQEEIKESIKKYVMDILNRNPDNDFADHRFSLYEFIKQANGCVKFNNK